MRRQNSCFDFCLAVTHRDNQQGAKLSFIAVVYKNPEHSDGGSLSVIVTLVKAAKILVGAHNENPTLKWANTRELLGSRNGRVQLCWLQVKKDDVISSNQV